VTGDTILAAAPHVARFWFLTM